MLTITPLYAGLLVLIYVALSALVVRQRFRVEMATGEKDETQLNGASAYMPILASTSRLV